MVYKKNKLIKETYFYSAKDIDKALCLFSLFSTLI